MVENTPENYPEQYTTTFTMKSGEKALLRPIKPSDTPLETELFHTFSRETQRFRFFELIQEVTPELIKRYTNVDYENELAIVAMVEENGEKKMAAVVRLVASEDKENAEIAIVVGDPWQGQGLGSKMLDYMIEIAKERGIKKLYADFLKGNKTMLKMFRRRGFDIKDQLKNYHATLQLV